MSVKILGEKELIKLLNEMTDNLKDKSFITGQLAVKMRNFVNVKTGYLKRSIFSNNQIAGASANYAGFVEERFGYATKAIDQFDIEEYADRILK